MSKQSQEKEFQGYVEKPATAVCATCQHYKCDRVKTCEGTSWKPEGWFEDKNKRCEIGGFAVKKSASCNLWNKAA